MNNVWLEKKLTEWGCMQALIDFDGWKKWKDLSMKEVADPAKDKKRQAVGKRDKQRSGGTSIPSTPTTTGLSNEGYGELKAITPG